MIALLALLGCTSDVVKGTIGGEGIEVRSVMFAEHPEAYGEGGDGLVFAVLTDLPDACPSYQSYLDESGGLTSPEEQADLWQSVFPPVFWEVVVVLRVPDTAVTYETQRFEGLDWYELLDNSNRFFARFSHHVAHRDAAWFDGTGDSEAYLDEFLSHQGTLHLQHHDPGLRLDATLDTLVVDTDGVVVQGVVKARFDAPLCAGIIGL